MWNRSGPWLITLLYAALAVSLLLQAVPALGWLSGAALLVGATAYVLMATNLLLAVRRPWLERLFGPLDQLYAAHRVIGTGILALIGIHLVLIPTASLVDRDQSLLDSPTAALPLGVLGLLMLVGSVALALSAAVPYDRWQRVHLAIGVAFVILTAHAGVAFGGWLTITSPAGVLLGLFAVIGLASLALRVSSRARGGLRYTVAEVHQRERSVELVLQPAGRPMVDHRPGQFLFLEAAADGAIETHPFTLTSTPGAVSVLVRDGGDWTQRLQSTVAVGDSVSVEGPFGAFCPPLTESTGRQVWVAGGSGVTPFVSALRTATRAAEDRGDSTVELVVAARDAADAPCWAELNAMAAELPWLTLTPAFSASECRVDAAMVGRLAARNPGADWYLCGPAGLIDVASRTLAATPGAATEVHREYYQWRASR